MCWRWRSTSDTRPVPRRARTGGVRAGDARGRSLSRSTARSKSDRPPARASPSRPSTARSMSERGSSARTAPRIVVSAGVGGGGTAPLLRLINSAAVTNPFDGGGGGVGGTGLRFRRRSMESRLRRFGDASTNAETT